MNLEGAAIPELVAYHIVGGSLVDLRHAERMLADLERQAPDRTRAANLGAIRGAMEQLRRVTGSQLKAPEAAWLTGWRDLGVRSRPTSSTRPMAY